MCHQARDSTLDQHDTDEPKLYWTRVEEMAKALAQRVMSKKPREGWPDGVAIEPEPNMGPEDLLLVMGHAAEITERMAIRTSTDARFRMH